MKPQQTNQGQPHVFFSTILFYTIQSHTMLPLQLTCSPTFSFPQVEPNPKKSLIQQINHFKT